ncbi:hypothetical protein D3C71_1370490 [compost metagenome]
MSLFDQAVKCIESGKNVVLLGEKGSGTIFVAEVLLQTSCTDKAINFEDIDISPDIFLNNEDQYLVSHYAKDLNVFHYAMAHNLISRKENTFSLEKAIEICRKSVDVAFKVKNNEIISVLQ